MGKAKRKNEKPKKAKRVSVEKKLQIIQQHESEPKLSNCQIARNFGITETSVRRILADKEPIKTLAKSLPSCSLVNATRKLDPINARMEMLLMKWFEDCINKRIPVSAGLLKSQAVSLHKCVQLANGVKEEDIKPFKGSKGK